MVSPPPAVPLEGERACTEDVVVELLSETPGDAGESSAVGATVVVVVPLGCVAVTVVDVAGDPSVAASPKGWTVPSEVKIQ